MDRVVEEQASIVSNDFVEAGLNQSEYESLEFSFQEVLRELAENPSLERYMNSYRQLYSALRTSYQSEKRLIQRCQELTQVITQNSQRVRTAIRLTQEDSQTISILRKEVDKAWSLVEQAKEKEEKARKLIAELRNEIQNLKQIVDPEKGQTGITSDTVHNFKSANEDLMEDIAKKQKIIDYQEQERMILIEKVQKLEHVCLNQNTELEQLKMEMQLEKQPQEDMAEQYRKQH